MQDIKVEKILGLTGTILAILMFTSIIEVAISNWKGESNIIVQPILTVINCVIWSIYACLRKDKFVFWSNVPGVFLGIITVLSAILK